LKVKYRDKKQARYSVMTRFASAGFTLGYRDRKQEIMMNVAPSFILHFFLQENFLFSNLL
jgi:hypothetical protein